MRVGFSQLGSGTVAYTNDVLTNIPAQTPNGIVYRDGMQIILVNPEDSSVHRGLETRQITLSAGVAARIDIGMPYRRAVAITNTSTNGTLYIGPTASVTTGTGHAVLKGSSIAFDMKNLVPIYGISSIDLTVTCIEVA